MPLDVVNLYRVFKGGDGIEPEEFYRKFSEEIENGLLTEKIFNLMVQLEWKVVQDRTWTKFKSCMKSCRENEKRLYKLATYDDQVRRNLALEDLVKYLKL